jgi:hypothetical protein
MDGQQPLNNKIPDQDNLENADDQLLTTNVNSENTDSKNKITNSNKPKWIKIILIVSLCITILGLSIFSFQQFKNKKENVNNVNLTAYLSSDKNEYIPGETVNFTLNVQNTSNKDFSIPSSSTCITGEVLYSSSKKPLNPNDSCYMGLQTSEIEDTIILKKGESKEYIHKIPTNYFSSECVEILGKIYNTETEPQKLCLKNTTESLEAQQTCKQKNYFVRYCSQLSVREEFNVKDEEEFRTILQKYGLVVMNHKAVCTAGLCTQGEPYELSGEYGLYYVNVPFSEVDSMITKLIEDPYIMEAASANLSKDTFESNTPN